MTALLVSMILVGLAAAVLTLHASGQRSMQVAVVRQPTRQRR
jgi:hypothetical protein